MIMIYNMYIIYIYMYIYIYIYIYIIYKHFLATLKPDFSCKLKNMNELRFATVVLYLMFKYYHKRLSSLMH